MQNTSYIAVLLISAAVALTYFFYGLGSVQEEVITDLECGFTTDFSNFLKNKGFDGWAFSRPDLKCAAYGGKENAKDTITHTPVIFIHGNSDLGFGRGTTDGYVSWQTGFRSLATFLTTQGYKKS